MDDYKPAALPILYDDNVEPEKIAFNITDKTAKVFAGVIAGVATLDLAATSFLLWITYVTSAMGGMKPCEKLLVYNVLIPDLFLELVLLYFIAPATAYNYWQHGVKDTKWLAFLHTFCIFHPHMAFATITYILALSKTDAYMFEMANDMKHMSVVVLSTIAVSICFCSLPATETQGYGLQETWLCPSFNTHHQYGSAFMCAGILGVVAYVELRSIYKLMEAKKFYQENITRGNKRVLEELEKEIAFSIICVVTACMAVPAIIGTSNSFLGFLPRMLVYICPFIRVTIFINQCPHFRFAYFGHEDVDDFAALDHQDILADKPIMMGAVPFPSELEEAGTEI